MLIQVTPATPTLVNNAKPENVLDSLLDELQAFATGNKPSSTANENKTNSSVTSSRRSLDLGKKTAPLPPPRSSSSKINEQQDQLRQLMMLQNNLTSPSSSANRPPPPTLPKPNVTRSNSEPCGKNAIGQSSTSNGTSVVSTTGECNGNSLNVQMALSISNTSLSSIDSQESVVNSSQRKSHEQQLEERHQELLRKQRLLQEKYSQLQQLVRGEIPKNLLNDLKKIPSETNVNDKTSKVNDLSFSNGKSSSSANGSNNALNNNNNHHHQHQVLSNDESKATSAAQAVYRTNNL